MGEVRVVQPIIRNTWKFLYGFSTFTGLRLLRNRGSSESACSAYLRKVIFVLIISGYTLGLVFLVCLCVGNAQVQLNDYFAFPLVWAAIDASGLVSFIALNFVTNKIYDSYFKTQSKTILSIVQPSTNSIKNWQRKFVVFSIVSLCMTFGIIIAVSLPATRILPSPFQMERLSDLLSVPTWFSRIVVGQACVMTAVHIYCYCSFCYTHCELLRLYFRAYCVKIKKEKASNFVKRKLVSYHEEYYRLIGLVQKLDNAFKQLYFFHVFTSMVIFCFMLFIFAKGDVRPIAFLHIVPTFCGFILAFSTGTIPGVMLNNQVK